MKIETNDLGLAAFIKMRGGRLMGIKSKVFVFECVEEQSVTEWNVQYSNSCCQKHDHELMGLRRLQG